MADPFPDLRGTLDFSGAPPLGSVEWYCFLARWFFLIWLPYPAKFPPRSGWQNNGTRDPAVVSSWFRDDVLGWPQECNVGALAWRFGDGHAAVVDVDVRDGKQGAETFAGLHREGLIARPLMTTRTASGGLHLWYQTPHPLKSGTNRLGPGVDVKSAGAYVVMPGSSLGGKRYTVEGLP